MSEGDKLAGGQKGRQGQKTFLQRCETLNKFVGEKRKSE